MPVGRLWNHCIGCPSGGPASFCCSAPDLKQAPGQAVVQKWKESVPFLSFLVLPTAGFHLVAALNILCRLSRPSFNICAGSPGLICPLCPSCRWLCRWSRPRRYCCHYCRTRRSFWHGECSRRGALSRGASSPTSELRYLAVLPEQWRKPGGLLGRGSIADMYMPGSICMSSLLALQVFVACGAACKCGPSQCTFGRAACEAPVT